MTLTQMDHIRGIIAQALIEDMTVADLWYCAEHAASIQALDNAVNILANMKLLEEIEQ
jgi:hypothetical protein